MEGWIDRGMDEKKDGSIGRRMDAWMSGWKDVWIDVLMSGCLYGCLDQ